jgi:heme a synthase
MQRRFSIFAWVVLAYNVLVILWGAYVRISFSGDGCGANWPFCNGQMIPRQMSLPTVIEYTHRMMTSLDSFLVITMCIWAFLVFPKRHAARSYSLIALVFLLIEALLGAGLVLFRYVTTDQSAGRAWYLSAHLTNTMLLLAAIAVTAWVARNGVEKLKLSRLTRSAVWALIVTVFVSITGAVTALGDTLFPASSIGAGMRQDFSSASSVLLRLRVIHPLIAVAGAAYLLWLASKSLAHARGSGIHKAAAAVAAITIVQLAAGLVNLTLLAPVWMQLTHLAIADILWIAVVILALETREIRT